MLVPLYHPPVLLVPPGHSVSQSSSQLPRRFCHSLSCLDMNGDTETRDQLRNHFLLACCNEEAYPPDHTDRPIFPSCLQLPSMPQPYPEHYPTNGSGNHVFEMSPVVLCLSKRLTYFLSLVEGIGSSFEGETSPRLLRPEGGSLSSLILLLL